MAKLVGHGQRPPEMPKALLDELMFGSAEKEPESPEAAESAQIDFSESLLDLCPRREGQRFGMPMEEEGKDPLAYEPVVFSEMAECDLPEDLPGLEMDGEGREGEGDRMDIDQRERE